MHIKPTTNAYTRCKKSHSTTSLTASVLFWCSYFLSRRCYFHRQENKPRAKYVKATTKNGQDGVNCENIYASCANAREDETIKQNKAILAMYQDINKLVQEDLKTPRLPVFSS